MSSGPTEDNEKGATVAADEVELARMGYKQELKFVYLSAVVSPAKIFPFSQTRPQSRAGTNSFKSPHEFVRNPFFRTLVSRSPLSVS